MTMKKSATKPVRTELTVAQYIDQQIAVLKKSQRAIAADLGYDKPNLITMIKQGHTRLPIDKVPAMAHSLGISPAYLMRMTLQEYTPQIWEAINASFGAKGALISEEEMVLIQVMREATKGTPLNLKENAAALASIRQVFTTYAAAEHEARENARKHQAALPRNARGADVPEKIVKVKQRA